MLAELHTRNTQNNFATKASENIQENKNIPKAWETHSQLRIGLSRACWFYTTRANRQKTAVRSADAVIESMKLIFFKSVEGLPRN